MLEEGDQQRRPTRRQIERGQRKQEVVPLWKTVLLAIPKNLVYIFVGIVFFSFVAMLWITYTEKDLQKFLSASQQSSKTVTVVDPLFTSLKYSIESELDKRNPKEMSVVGFSGKQFFDEYLSENRPLVVRGYANEWPATKKWTDFDYLGNLAGNTIVNLKSFSKLPFSLKHTHTKDGKALMPRNNKNILKDLISKAPIELGGGSDADDHEDTNGLFSQRKQKPNNSLQTVAKALERVAENGQNSEERISFLDFEPLRMHAVKKDYAYPVLQDFLRPRGVALSIWPKFEHKPIRYDGESWHCVIDGQNEIRLASPVFNQNLYLGVFEEVPPTMLPDDIDLYSTHNEKYPLLGEVEEYILAATLEKGDCVYLPSLWWAQFAAVTDAQNEQQAMMLSFEYEESSKFVELLFQAISQDLHKQD